jgi:hypothetical protein
MRVFLMLLALAASAFSQEKTQPPPVHLNHAFIVPDDAMYEAVRSSKFLREEFAVNEERTTKRTDISYTGVYFYGKHTYFEFLKPSAAFPRGGWSIAFGVDGSGELEKLARHLKNVGIETAPLPITRPNANGEQVPWFRMISAGAGGGSMGVWTIEYDPEFLKRWNAAAGKVAGVTREAVLARYGAVLKKNPNNFLMEDIIGITLRLPQAAIERSLAECKALGLEVTAETCRAPALEIRVLPTTGAAGIAQLKFRLRKAQRRSEATPIGSSNIEFPGGRTAVWTFPLDAATSAQPMN